MRPPATAPLPRCPACGDDGYHSAALRQEKAIGPRAERIGIVDVGWRCRACGHEFGFEFLTCAPPPDGRYQCANCSRPVSLVMEGLRPRWEHDESAAAGCSPPEFGDARAEPAPRE